jgi:hypothetical protein
VSTEGWACVKQGDGSYMWLACEEQENTTLILETLRRNRAPFKLQFLFRVHNFLLSAGSAILLALMLEEM